MYFPFISGQCKCVEAYFSTEGQLCLHFQIPSHLSGLHSFSGVYIENSQWYSPCLSTRKREGTPPPPKKKTISVSSERTLKVMMCKFSFFFLVCMAKLVVNRINSILHLLISQSVLSDMGGTSCLGMFSGAGCTVAVSGKYSKQVTVSLTCDYILIWHMK